MSRYIATFLIEVEDKDDLGRVMDTIENVHQLGDFRDGVKVTELSLEADE